GNRKAVTAEFRGAHPSRQRDHDGITQRTGKNADGKCETGSAHDSCKAAVVHEDRTQPRTDASWMHGSSLISGEPPPRHAWSRYSCIMLAKGRGFKPSSVLAFSLL